MNFSGVFPRMRRPEPSSKLFLYLFIALVLILMFGVFIIVLMTYFSVNGGVPRGSGMHSTNETLIILETLLQKRFQHDQELMKSLQLKSYASPEELPPLVLKLMLDVNVSDHSKTLDISAVNLNRPNHLQEVHVNQPMAPSNYLPMPGPTLISPVLPSLDYQESAEHPRIKLGNNLGNNIWPETGINFPAVPTKNNNVSNFLADLPDTTTKFSLAFHTTSPAPYLLPERKSTCQLDVIGKPILHTDVQLPPYGSWMLDTAGTTLQQKQSRWILVGDVSSVLYEYASEEEIARNSEHQRYYLAMPVSGFGAVVYNRSLYYHQLHTKDILRYDLDAKGTLSTRLEFLEICQEPCSKTLFGLSNHFVQFAVDENGLWIIYRVPNDQMTIAMLDPFSLKPKYTVTIPYPKLQQGFIACGIFYGIQSRLDRYSYINFAFDLYTKQYLTAYISWTNSYESLISVQYNANDNRLYLYDNGRLLSAPGRTVPLQP